MSTELTIKKTDDQTAEEQRIVWAEVYAPNRPDSEGDFMNAEEIQKTAHAFMRKMALDQIDVMHDNKQVAGVQVVESFIARDDDKVFIPGSWVLGVHVADDATWEAIKKGELNGFSIEALAQVEDVDVEIEIPPVVSGTTSIHKGDKSEHGHKFYVSYDAEGNFLGGTTDTVDGHFHKIKAGTVTEGANGHNHKFSAVDNILVIQ